MTFCSAWIGISMIRLDAGISDSGICRNIWLNPVLQVFAACEFSGYCRRSGSIRNSLPQGLRAR
ncbi:MAG: hypothetical protein J6W00_01935 [Lentisphaeria bacterium]|nr:hypothetical protein [Lentisphaeria bacterium]